MESNRGDVKVVDVKCTKLKSKFESLYASFHVSISVDSADMKRAIELFMAAESWPMGVFVKRFFKQKMTAKLRICTFNCRSVKSSISEVKRLCNRHDVVLLQEHWLLPHDISSLNDIHSEFLSVGLSAVDTSKDILVGRPYGTKRHLLRVYIL